MIKASVERIVLRNEDNEYTILMAINRRISKDKITITGIIASINEG